MGTGRFLIVQDLTIQQVDEDASGVSAGVVTAAGAHHTIRFAEPHPGRRTERATALRGWHASGTALTYVRTPSSGSLVDDAAAFTASFGAACD